MTAARFAYFVVLAGMRTGSNLLEEYLSAMPGLVSYGELFNPHFFGKPKTTELFGMTMDDRDRDPVRVIETMRMHGGGLPGFRLFYDHDSRVIDHVLRDEGAAKIVLTRRPVDSYVSLKIARKTGQWWLGDMSSARSAKVSFDAAEYAQFLNTLSSYQDRIRHALQTTGQTAFHVDYSELSDPEVVSGLGRFLGAEAGPDTEKVRAKVQNPRPVEDRLSNPSDAEALLQRLATTDLGRIPIHEPERGPGLRMFHVCETTPLVYMPIRGAGRDPVPDWLRRVDPGQAVNSGLTQKDLRQWLRRHPGHRSFTILRHPLARAYDAFCRFILPVGEESYGDIRAALLSRYGVVLPEDGPDTDWTLERQREAFLGFLRFLEGNLGGQTSVRVDYSWASQEAFLSAIASFALPDRVMREETAARELAELAQLVGCEAAPEFAPDFSADHPFPLAEVRTGEIDRACAAAYRRDYVFFGFKGWAEA